MGFSATVRVQSSVHKHEALDVRGCLVVVWRRYLICIWLDSYLRWYNSLGNGVCGA